MFFISVLWEIKLPKTNPDLKHKSGHKQPPPSFTVKKCSFYQRVEEDPLCVTSRLEINPRNITEALSASPPTHITADRGIDSVTWLSVSGSWRHVSGSGRQRCHGAGKEAYVLERRALNASLALTSLTRRTARVSVWRRQDGVCHELLALWEEVKIWSREEEEEEEAPAWLILAGKQQQRAHRPALQRSI